MRPRQSVAGVQGPLEGEKTATGGGTKTSAPIGTSKPMSDNKYCAPRVYALAADSGVVFAKVVASTQRPGGLSLRLMGVEEVNSWSPFFAALTIAGFKPGDVVEIKSVRE